MADLRQRLGGELALHVREGKGAKERLVPYGELSFCLPIVNAWLKAAGIDSGPVFRGFYKGSKRVLATLVTTKRHRGTSARWEQTCAGRQQFTTSI